MKNTVLAALASVIMFSASALAGPPAKVIIHVKGISCPFCAYGLEKKLKGLEGVTDFSMDLEGGKAEVFFSDRDLIKMEKIENAVRDSGFTPGKIEVKEAQGEEG